MRGKKRKENAPETPSPKKKSNGGFASFLYGRIAWDLSCPYPLRG